MVAYSFKRRFVEPIQSGTKRQTIRAERKRHARAGEPLQLYTGMRTRSCRLLGTSICLGVEPIRIALRAPRVEIGNDIPMISARLLDVFSRADGFGDWPDMVAFWTEAHPGVDIFSCVLVRWDELL